MTDLVFDPAAPKSCLPAHLESSILVRYRLLTRKPNLSFFDAELVLCGFAKQGAEFHLNLRYSHQAQEPSLSCLEDMTYAEGQAARDAFGQWVQKWQGDEPLRKTWAPWRRADSFVGIFATELPPTAESPGGAVRVDTRARDNALFMPYHVAIATALREEYDRMEVCAFSRQQKEFLTRFKRLLKGFDAFAFEAHKQFYARLSEIAVYDVV